MVINNFGDVRKNEDDDDDDENDDEDANKKLSGRFYIQMHRHFLFSIWLSNFAPLLKAWLFTKSNLIFNF